MKKIFLILITLVPFLTKAQVTLIPDQNFEQRLINMNIDSDGVINGQILTSDAIAATYLVTGGQYYPIDLTGLDAFINLETLDCYYTPVNGYATFTGMINVSTMLNLKELNVAAANLSSIDVSNNTLLEKIMIGNEHFMEGIVILNDIKKLDLSNNPNIKYVDTFNLFDFNFLNMRNNTADSVVVNLGNNFNRPYNVCIEVDDPVSATNGTAPYDTWIINNTSSGNHFFSDNCALSTENFILNNFKIYPNPAAEYVSVEYDENAGVQLRGVQILDSSGK